MKKAIEENFSKRSEVRYCGIRKPPPFPFYFLCFRIPKKAPLQGRAVSKNWRRPSPIANLQARKSYGVIFLGNDIYTYLRHNLIGPKRNIQEKTVYGSPKNQEPWDRIPNPQFWWGK